MRDLAILVIHLIATIARLLLPGGARSIVSESLLLKHQPLILNRSRARAPNLRPIDRIIASLCGDTPHDRIHGHNAVHGSKGLSSRRSISRA
jgi:hypothetical protein